MHPPAGRVKVGDRVVAPGNRQGDVMSERQIATNGAWVYVVRFADGSSREHHDFELRPASAA
jgi:hypothetical protein